MKEPEEIDDCEVIVDKFQLYHKECIGPKKYDKYLMLRIKHDHTTDKDNDFGHVDIFMDKYQALNLIEDLARMIATNDLLYPDKEK